MRLLVTGAKGQVGSEIVKLGQNKKCEIVGLSRASLDITNKDAVSNSIKKYKPDLVINAAAYTSVDHAETEQDLAFSINRDGAGIVATACAKAKIPVVYISTDYVFDGTKETSYCETDPVNPLGVYGRSKEEGERAVRQANDRHIVLRTSWVFGETGHNFVKSILRLAKERNKLGIVDDQWGGPTDACEIAEALLTIACKIEAHRSNGGIPWGTYHFSGVEPVSWFNFAKAILGEATPYLDNPPSLEAISTEEYPTPARRPRNSILNCQKIGATFALSQPTWRPSVKRLVTNLCKNGDKAA